MDIAEFLIARIDEDEVVANRALHHGVCGYDYAPGRVDTGVWSVENWHGEDRVITGPGITIYDEGGHTEGQATHIARHDPARVLADCEARRKLADLHQPTEEHARFDEFGVQCTECADHYYGCDYPCDTLKILALPYRDHPDFDPAWAVA